MTTTDRTPIIVALLADLVRERSLAAPNEADLHHLSDGLALAVDHRAVATTWPPTEIDSSHAMLLADMLRGIMPDNHVSDGPGASVARRLADVAASLLVRGDVHRAEAGALWKAAGRLMGLQDEAPEQVDRERLQVHVDLATAMAQRDPQMTYVATAGGVVVESNRTVYLRDQTICNLRADLASMTEQRDEAIRQRDKALRQVKAWQCEEDERRRERDEARSKAGHVDIVAKLLARTYETVTVALGRPASETPHLLDPGVPGDIASAVRLVVEERDVARADLASMTEQRDEAIRQRDEARRERDAAQFDVRQVVSVDGPGHGKPPAAVVDDGGDPTSIRNIAIAAGARECSVFFDTRQVVVAVVPAIDVHLGTIAEAVLRSVPLADPKTYVVRSTGFHRQEYTETPEDRQRRHATSARIAGTF